MVNRKRKIDHFQDEDNSGLEVQNEKNRMNNGNIITTKKRSLKDRAKQLENMKAKITQKSEDSDSSSDSSDDSEEDKKPNILVKKNVHITPKRDEIHSNKFQNGLNTTNKNGVVQKNSGHILFDSRGDPRPSSCNKKPYINQFNAIPKTQLSEQQKSEIISSHLQRSVPNKKAMIKGVKITPDTHKMNKSNERPKADIIPFQRRRRNSYGNQAFTSKNKPVSSLSIENGILNLCNDQKQVVR